MALMAAIYNYLRVPSPAIFTNSGGHIIAKQASMKLRLL
jgi:hypothetical protein